MGTSQREPGRRDAIVEAAYQCVADKGLYGLRMRDVGAAAGVNIATVHYHLTSKSDLIRAVVEHGHDVFLRHAAPPEHPDPARRVVTHLDRVFALLEDDPRLAHVLAEVALHARRDPVVAQTVIQAEERWRLALERMMAPLPRRQSGPIARLVILAVKGACLPPADPAGLRAARRELTRLVELRLDTRSATPAPETPAPPQRTPAP
ncbi:TetR/AcrR family transcriptional regulator [Dactylosporangium salmoneum]|uniref:HTH tetR-type domain-containing protein n=1 Tax=Dactylosporangium salmoneum TaxID=53361 RepID=A0ABN3HWT5_9ACTN